MVSLFKLINYRYIGKKRSGQSLVELMIVIGLCTLLLPVLVSMVANSRQGKPQEKQRIGASALLKETTEILRLVREKGWDGIVPINNSHLHPEMVATSYSLFPGDEIIGNFTRYITLNPVISAGKTDPSVVQANITVSWDKPISSAISSTILLSRLFPNEFSTVGSEVSLELGGNNGDWCAPSSTLSEFDLPKNGVANAISAKSGRIFAGTGDNSSGVSFASLTVDTASVASPWGVNQVGTFNGYKTNDVYGDENYAYLATDTNKQQAVILNLKNYTSALGYFDLDNNSKNGESVYAEGDIGYMTSGNTLYTFDISNKAKTIKASQKVTLAGVAKNVMVLKNYVYVAEIGTTQLEIYYTPNVNTITRVAQGSYNAGNGISAYIDIFSHQVFLVTNYIAGKNNLFVINIHDVNNPSNPTIIKSYQTSGMDPKGVTAVQNGSIAIIVGVGGTEYQVVKIGNVGIGASMCGSVDTATDINGVSSVVEDDGDVFSYIVTRDASAELKIIQGGAGSGGGLYKANRTYISPAISFVNPVVFNHFEINENLPPGTNISFQVGVADPISGSCDHNNYTFIGPNKTSDMADVFLTGASIPWGNFGTFYNNPARCFKYKAYLSTNNTNVTPKILGFNINYSP